MDINTARKYHKRLATTFQRWCLWKFQWCWRSLSQWRTVSTSPSCCPRWQSHLEQTFSKQQQHFISGWVQGYDWEEVHHGSWDRGGCWDGWQVWDDVSCPQVSVRGVVPAQASLCRACLWTFLWCCSWTWLPSLNTSSFQHLSTTNTCFNTYLLFIYLFYTYFPTWDIQQDWSPKLPRPQFSC